MTNHQEDDKRLRALLDLVSEEPMSWSDDEVRSRAAQEGFDLAANLKAFRTKLEQARAEPQERLKHARRLLDLRMHPKITDLAKSSKDELQARLNVLIAAQGQARYGLTLRHREGKEMSEEDLRSLIEDYEELEQLDKAKPDSDKQ
jgi:hypothetical protein